MTRISKHFVSAQVRQFPSDQRTEALASLEAGKLSVQSNTDCTHGTIGARSQFRLDSPCQGAAKQARHRWFGFSLLISSVKVFETIYPDQRNLYISGHLMG
jgi:hypothetical protein